MGNPFYFLFFGPKLALASFASYHDPILFYDNEILQYPNLLIFRYEII